LNGERGVHGSLHADPNIVLLGVVQTAEGLPIYHEVFAGNAAETHTLVPTIKNGTRALPDPARGAGGRSRPALAG
jgi:hypothetical protein